MKRRLPVLAAGLIILFALGFRLWSEKIVDIGEQNDIISEETSDSSSLQPGSPYPIENGMDWAAALDPGAALQKKDTEEDAEEHADEDLDSDSPKEEDGAAQFSESELPGHLKYYYGTLTEDDKLLYREIYVVMRDHLDYTQVNTTDSDKIADVMEYVLLDNPELFYVDSLKTQTTTVGSTSTMKITAEEIMTEGEQAEASGKLSEYTGNVLAGISGSMSEYEKALYIYKYIVSHVQYVDGAPYNQSLYSAVLGQTVCRGYASAFKFLCDQVGISCIMVTGTMQAENHAWNLVCIDGQWCHVDCTAGDDLEGNAIAVDYSWFGMDDSTLLQSHTINHASLLPAASSLANSYYYKNGLYFESYSAANLTGLLSAGADFSFQCATEAVYDQYCNELSGSQEIAQAIGSGRQVQFMGNRTTRTIYIMF